MSSVSNNGIPGGVPAQPQMEETKPVTNTQTNQAVVPTDTKTTEVAPQTIATTQTEAEKKISLLKLNQ